VPWIPNPDAATQTWLRARSHTFALEGLVPGTLYHILVTATDAEGRTAYRLGTFKTSDPPPLPPAVHHENGWTVFVTFWKVKVLNDADKRGKGEITFRYALNDEVVDGDGQRKLKSGQSFRPHAPEWPHVVDNAPGLLDIKVGGTECDALGWDCLEEACGDSGCGTLPPTSDSDQALAHVTLDVDDLSHGALPGNFGTDMPPGHDAYVIFESPDEVPRVPRLRLRRRLLRLSTVERARGAEPRARSKRRPLDP
jgi:hypothetical protein